MAPRNIKQKQNREYYENIFNKYDLDGSGNIDVNELKMLLMSDADIEVSHKIVKKLIKYSDKDNDGKINLTEFVNMVQERKFRQLFGKYLDSYVNFVVPRQKRIKLQSLSMFEMTDEPHESEQEGEYEDNYSCWPPPIALVVMSLLEIACFVTDEGSKSDPQKLVGGLTSNILIYDPYRRQECWRFLTYMLVHIGYVHLIVNLLTQVLLGIPLEMVNQGWRVLTVYFSGVVAGSLVTSIMDPNTYLAGASGGVYAIITSHISNIILNWSEMTFPSIQLLIFFILIATDVGTAIHNRYYLHLDQNIGYAAHFGGALAGLLVGIWVLKNVEPTEKEKYLWWIAFIIYILLMGTAIMLNIFWTDHFRAPAV